jgi:endoglucanase
MGSKFICRPALHFFLCAHLALLATSCRAPSPSATFGKHQQRDPAANFTRTSAELLSEIGLGWNLGNSLDVPENETAWGNPIVTPELLVAVADAGFDLVRIPVTWSQHTGPGPDYLLEKDWLERVATVVSYAHAAGLYAIINLHHDGADGFAGVEWLALNDDQGNTTKANNAAVRARFVAVWTQIATYFSNYGEELLFESMNEIHDGYGPPDPRHFAFINDLNQQFVDLVRASGGNNAQRHLIIPGYNTNIDHTLAGFKKPTDPTADHLILSVHYYDPYLFALQAEIHTWGSASPGSESWGQEEFALAQFDKLKSAFIDQGLPVLLGEYGATNQAGFADYRRYYMEFITKAAVDRGIVPVYWDNGGRGSGSENFAIIDRHTHSALHPELLKAMLRAATNSYQLSDIAPPAPSK